ncbi:MAG: hypothetical protein WBG46_02420 [Nonlabens sp.]
MKLKSCILLIFTVCLQALFSQNIDLINKDLHLPDSLDQDIEIRVYMDVGITNYTSLLRIFKSEDNWTTEFYEHFAAVDDVTDLNTTLDTLVPKNHPDYVYQNLLVSYINKLPSQTDIQWKMNLDRFVKKFTETYRGKEKTEYWAMFSKISFSDGRGYSFKIKNADLRHSFSYGNPFGYKEKFPEIDEINYVCEIIDKLIEEYDLKDYKN